MNTQIRKIYHEHLLTSNTKELEQEIIKHGVSSELLSSLADSLFGDGNYLRALSCYIKLLSLEPENARVWNKLAVTFIKLNEFNTAVEMSRIAHTLINKEISE